MSLAPRYFGVYQKNKILSSKKLKFVIFFLLGVLSGLFFSPVFAPRYKTVLIFLSDSE